MIKDFTHLDALTKYQLNALKSITPDIMKVYNHRKIDTFADAVKKIIPDVSQASSCGTVASLSDTIKKLIPEVLQANDVRTISGFSETIKRLTPDVFQASSYGTVTSLSDTIKKLIPEVLQANDVRIVSGFSETIKRLTPDVFQASSYGTVTSLSDTIKKLIPEVLQANDVRIVSGFSETIKSLIPNSFQVNNFAKVSGILPTLNSIYFDDIKSLNTTVAQTINDISEKNEVDESDIEKIKCLSNYALGMSLSNDLPARVKNNILVNWVQNLWKLVGIPQFQFLLGVIAIIINCYSPSNDISHNTIINQTLNQIIIIERDCKELNLRGIINNDTKVYIKPNTNSTTIFTLDCGDIIEVLTKNKKWIYIRIYKTDIAGWVLKKYTKAPNNRRINYLNI